jgi:hypothetical protein
MRSAKKKTMKKSSVICYGEFDWRDNNAKTSYIRNAFTSAIEEHAPNVWRALYDQVLPIHRQLRVELPHFTYRDYHYYVTSPLSHDLTRAPYVQCGKLALLIYRLNAWSQTWNLVETHRSATRWVFEIALMNLEIWAAAPFARDEEPEYFSAGAGFHGPIPSSPGPPEGFPKYDPITIQQKEYLEWIRKQAVEAIQQHAILKHGAKPKQNALVESVRAAAERYCHQVDQVYESSQFKRTTEAQKKNLARHLEWTVRVQVKGETIREVADSTSVKPSSVSRAVDEILNMVGISKREDLKRGRIVGSKNQRPTESNIRRNLAK